MARGDFFGFPVKIDNKNECLLCGVCDSSIIAAHGEWNNNFDNLGSGNDFNAIAQLIDTVIPYTWQAIKFPLWIPDNMREIYDPILKNFPSIDLVSLDTFKSFENTALYYNNLVVPVQNSVVKVETSLKPNGSTISGIFYNSNGTWEFAIGHDYAIPVMHNGVIYSDQVSSSFKYKVELQYYFMVAPDEFIQNGKINMEALTGYSMNYCWIRIIKYVKSSVADDIWEAIIQYETTQPIQQRVIDFWNGVELPVITPSDDPYKPGGEIEPGGGEGDFDDTSDPIDFPTMPTLSAVDTGFITLFNPTVDQLKSLSSYMWSDLFDVAGWKKIFADPMDAILGLTIVPVAVPNGGTGTVTVGNISTGISMTKAAGQYVEIDCGTLNVNEYWGAYLDYDPYTKAEIYLPFIGIHAISTDDIMKKPVHVKYHIDLLSGACCAYVKCGDSVLYSFVGQCSCSVPTTSTDWTNIINGALSIAGSIGTMVATGGASAPMVAGTIASAAVNALKPTIEKSGSMGGMGGMLGVQQPYLILTRPRQALPPRLNVFNGYPSFMTRSLGELSGFTIVDSIHLENIPATGAELSEIESLLMEGVIL